MKPSKKKQSKAKTKNITRSGNFLKSSRNTKLKFIPFILVFAVVGCYMLWRSFAATGYQLKDEVVTNPAVTDISTHSRVIAAWGDISATLYGSSNDLSRWVSFRNTANGTTTNVKLPYDVVDGFYKGRVVMTSSTELWISGQGGNKPGVYLRHYQLSGSPLPTSATLVATRVFGNSDSRVGDLIKLASGGLTLSWYQQGATGPNGQSLAYRSPSGTWSEVGPLTFVPTVAGNQAMAQHPADNSIWVFIVADAWGDIGVTRLTETSTGLRVDWTNPKFLADTVADQYRTDPENPDVEAVPDPYTGTIALAYQGNERKIFNSDYNNFVAGSYPVVMRIQSDGAKSFLQLPVYTERIASIGLIVRPGETWLAYHRLKESDLSFDKLYVSQHTDGSWQEPVYLGTFQTSPDKPGHSYENISYGETRPEFLANMGDGKIHFYSFVSSASSDTTAPTVSLTAPAAGSNVSGIVNVSATATDNIGVAKVEFSVDGVVANTDLISPFGFTWDTTGLTANSSHTVSAVAYDAAGNASTRSQATVTVQATTTPPPPPTGDLTAPAVTISTPADGSTITGRVTIAATGSDNTKVTKMEILIDGVLIKTSKSGSISTAWNTRSVSNGSHTITVKAYDAAGNVGQSSVAVIKK